LPSKQESSDESEEENFSLLSKKFSRFLKRNRNKEANKERYGNKKTSDFNSNNYTCFGCGEQGHIKADLAMKRNQATRRRRENQEEHILLGMKMKSPHQAPHQVKMKRQTYA